MAKIARNEVEVSVVPSVGGKVWYTAVKAWEIGQNRPVTRYIKLHYSRTAAQRFADSVKVVKK